MKILITCAIIFLCNHNVFATEYFVSSASEIHSAMNSAQPGDTLTMTAGTWTDQQIYFSGNGVESDSIMLRTEIPGHVILNGSSNIRINGTYLKVDGLRFIGGYNLNSAIEFTSGSHHCRVTNTVVAEFNPPNAATRYHWVEIKGSHNRLDHCLLKGMRHNGVTVIVTLTGAPYGHHRIDSNNFEDKPEGDGNGYETIRVATGAYSDLNGNVIVEHNFFYQCNGEIEVISNKCCNNIYRYNTLFECQGTLTLRQGTNCVVEGNYFFGNRVTDTGGIRIIHRGHKVINNYLQDLGGNSQRSAITLYAGMDDNDYVPGDGGHVRADSILVAHNTIVNCAAGLYSGAWDSDDLIILPPKDNIVGNNIITMNNNSKCYTRDANHAGINEFWEGNMLYGAQLGDVPNSGYVVADPELGLLNGWYQITASSPAVNAAAGYYPDVNDDIDGIVRDAHKDIGADEVGSGPRQPLTRDDVGPGWLHNSDVPYVLSIKFKGEGSGSVVSDPIGNIYAPGTKVILTAIPNTNHTFAGWSGDIVSTENPFTLIMNSDKYINAVFNLPVRYTLAVWKIGSGSVEFNPPGGSYPESTVVKIHGIPSDGWSFSHWGGALTSTNNPDSLLMDSDKGLTVTFIQSTDVEADERAPLTYRLNQNYPNPFNPKTTITFSLKHTGFTTFSVFDVTGCQVAQIINQNLDAGFHRVEFDASALASGVYFYTITTPEFNSRKKMILLR